MKLIPAKTIVTKNRNPNSWFGHDYNMNIYKGCCHGCIYCDSRSDCYHVDNFDEVRAKENALAIINRELRSKKTAGVIGTGAMSDPYNPFEKEYKLTRNALELINAYEFGAAIATKSDLVVRDIDILSDIKQHSPVCIKLTITTFDDNLRAKIEPNVSSSSERFKALEKLAANDIYCGVLLMPVLPFINDKEDNVLNIVKAAAEAGAKFIYPWFGVTLRQNQRDYYYMQLNKHFPGARQKYIERFENNYMCMSPDSRKLRRVFKDSCDRYNMLYDMQDIINAYKKNYKNSQLSLF